MLGKGLFLLPLFSFTLPRLLASAAIELIDLVTEVLRGCSVISVIMLRSEPRRFSRQRRRSVKVCFGFGGGGLIPATEVSAYNTNTSQLTLAAPCSNSIFLLTVFLPQSDI